MELMSIRNVCCWSRQLVSDSKKQAIYEREEGRKGYNEHHCAENWIKPAVASVRSEIG